MIPPVSPSAYSAWSTNSGSCSLRIVTRSVNPSVTSSAIVAAASVVLSAGKTGVVKTQGCSKFVLKSRILSPRSVLQQVLNRRGDVLALFDLQLLRRRHIAQGPLGHDGVGDAQSFGFIEALAEVGHIADLPGQADLADAHEPLGQGSAIGRAHV